MYPEIRERSAFCFITCRSHDTDSSRGDRTADKPVGQQHTPIHADMQPPSTQRKLNELSYQAGGCRVNAALLRHPLTVSLPPPLGFRNPPRCSCRPRCPNTQHGLLKLDNYWARQAGEPRWDFSLSQSVCGLLSRSGSRLHRLQQKARAHI